jgi:hypothetical protein
MPSEDAWGRALTREVRRISTMAGFVVVGAYVIAMVILLQIGASGTVWGVAFWTAFGGFALFDAAVAWPIVNRRFRALAEVLVWSHAANRQAWVALDGGDLPRDPSEGLERLGDRHDDAAVAMRLTCLGTLERSAEMHELVASWHPDDPVHVARRARAAGLAAALGGEVDDLTDARNAAAAIEDPETRIEQEASVHQLAAWLAVLAGKSPFPEILEARRLLGPRATDPGPDWPATRRSIAIRLVVGAAIPAAFIAVIALVLWSGMLG